MDDPRKFLSAIRNPLSIIAVFVFLIEGLATIALRNNCLTESQRYWFVVFCTVFPLLVLVAFFFIAWFKPVNFYGPTDYSNENVFLQLMKKGKIEDEIDEMTKDETDSSGGRMAMISSFLHAEKLALNELRKEYPSLESGQRSCTGYFLFDGIIPRGNKLIYVEVKYLSTGSLHPGTLESIRRFIDAAGKESDKILAIVSLKDLDKSKREKIETTVSAMSDNISFRYYVLKD